MPRYRVFLLVLAETYATRERARGALRTDDLLLPGLAAPSRWVAVCARAAKCIADMCACAIQIQAAWRGRRVRKAVGEGDFEFLGTSTPSGTCGSGVVHW